MIVITFSGAHLFAIFIRGLYANFTKLAHKRDGGPVVESDFFLNSDLISDDFEK